jgi:hypothetical protein
MLLVLLRVPLWNQPVQGDDVYYFAGAEHAQIDPAHPGHTSYVFLGDEVDMRGHPHPPLNAWILGAILAIFGDIREVPFHAVYTLFSLIAAMAMLALARRFVPDRVLFATLLFLVVPAFVINGNSFESDLPFLAFWMGGFARFIGAVDRRDRRQLLASCLALGLASLAAYQAVVAIPILWLYVWHTRRDWRPAWWAALTPAIVLLAWQAFERLSTGALPATVLAGYVQAYNWQTLTAKLSNAAALTVHTGWMIFPLLALVAFRSAWPVGVAAALGGAFLDSNPLFWFTFGCGAMVIGWCLRNWRDFLSQWVLVFFAASLALFFAGSARYLLPMAAPLVLLAVRETWRPKLLWAAFCCQLALVLALSLTNYQHWDGYRQFVRSLASEIQHKRTWINGEWGLRFYAESEGGLPLRRGQALRAGDLVLSSEIGYPIPFTVGGGQLTPYRELEIRPTLPLRLIGVGAKSAYSTASLGLRPFDISFNPVDRVRASLVTALRPQLEYLPMNSPQASQHIVSGVFELESGQWRWMTDRATFLLKPPPQPKPLRVDFYIPDTAPARRVTLLLDGQTVAESTFEKPGTYSVVSSAALRAAGDTATLSVVVDKTFSVPGDTRKLGVILSGAGWR